MGINQKQVTIQSATLERTKIDYCRYEYFVQDDSGKRVKGIDSKYYNCKQIGSIASQSEVLEDIDEIRWYDTSFNYFTFAYNVKIPKHKLEQRDNSDNERNKEIVLKAIIDDAGTLVMDGIEEIHEFISSIGAIIIKLPIYQGCKWQNRYENSSGEDNDFWAVINLNGEILIKPERAKIEFLKKHKLFVVGDHLLFNQSGEKLGMAFSSLFNDGDDFSNFRHYRLKLQSF